MKPAKTLFSLAIISIITAVCFANSAPVVSSVTANQRNDDSKLVDIYYNLSDADGDTCTVWVAASNDSGETWKLFVSATSGNIGRSVTPGNGKHIVWDAGRDMPGMVGDLKVRVYADDGKNSDNLIIIQGGSFLMGDSFNEGIAHEKPVHSVTVSSFMMSKFEVTNQQFCEFLNNVYPAQIEVKADNIVYKVGTDSVYCKTISSNVYSCINFTGSAFTVKSGYENRPMVTVSWYGAVAYCNWRSQQVGWQQCYDLNTWNCDFSKTGFRLPTEAEWEFAARGGLSGKRFPWGDTISQTQDNFYSFPYNPDQPYDVSPIRNRPHPIWTGSYPFDLPFTSSVGFFDGTMKNKADYNWPASATTYQTASGSNGYGLYDMAGNASEWCNDRYDASYYSSSPGVNPTGPASGAGRVCRGGNWDRYAYHCRVACRDIGVEGGYSPSFSEGYSGFRIVLDFQ